MRALVDTCIHLNTLNITEVDVDVCTYGIWPSNTSLSPILLSTPTFLFPSISPLSHPFPLLLLHYRAVRSDCTYFWCNWGGHADSHNTPPHIVKWGGPTFRTFFHFFSGAWLKNRFSSWFCLKSDFNRFYILFSVQKCAYCHTCPQKIFELILA